MSERDPQLNELVINYVYLRKTVGWIGALLPVVLLVGNTIFTTVLPDSISSYYYTHMRNVFVGALCALGVFLIAYAGYDEWDRWITNIAGGCAVGVALCATKPAVCAAGARSCPPPSVRVMSQAQNIVGDVHVVFAMLMFVALAIMALRFAKTTSAGAAVVTSIIGRLWSFLGFDPAGAATARSSRKRGRDVVYRVCGFLIVACVILAVVSNFLPQSLTSGIPVLYILESIAVFAFGVSWFVKGQTLLPVLKDPRATAARQALSEAA